MHATEQPLPDLHTDGRQTARSRRFPERRFWPKSPVRRCSCRQWIALLSAVLRELSGQDHTALSFRCPSINRENPVLTRTLGICSRITCPQDSSPVPRTPPRFSLLPRVCPRRRRSTLLPPPVRVR